MIPLRYLSSALAATLMLALFAACQIRPTPRLPTIIPEQSVRPGVNTEYLKPDLNVSQWVERFEREGREIYDQRQEIVRAAKIKRGSKVADIGSGTGLFTMLFAQEVGSRGKVYAAEIVAAGFHKIEEVPAVKDNYILRFRKLPRGGSL